MKVEGILLISVTSSNVRAIGYNKPKKLLYIQFKDNSVYRYTDVPESTWRMFQTAPSKGKFIWRSIRDKFEYEKLT